MRSLTKKQREFIKAYTETGNGTRSALQVYNAQNYSTAHAIAAENLQKPTIRLQIEKAWRSKNIGPERWADVIDESLAAVTVQGMPDYPAKLKAVELSAKLVDAFPHEKTSHEHRHLHVEVTEPIESIRFRILHGRAPTARELAELQSNRDSLVIIDDKKTAPPQVIDNTEDTDSPTSD